MSKLIVEMEMPTRCRACKCRHVEFDIDYVAVFCGIKDNEYVEDPDSRPSWCPICGVLPEEHGDLVDRDEVKHKMIYYGFRTIDMTATEFCEDELQTVIAAERKDDEQIH